MACQCARCRADRVAGVRRRCASCQAGLRPGFAPGYRIPRDVGARLDPWRERRALPSRAIVGLNVPSWIRPPVREPEGGEREPSAEECWGWFEVGAAAVAGLALGALAGYAAGR